MIEDQDKKRKIEAKHLDRRMEGQLYPKTPIVLIRIHSGLYEHHAHLIKQPTIYTNTSENEERKGAVEKVNCSAVCASLILANRAAVAFSSS